MNSFQVSVLEMMSEFNFNMYHFKIVEKCCEFGVKCDILFAIFWVLSCATEQKSIKMFIKCSNK